MSYHDIYDSHRERTGLKFSDKTTNLRSADEFSLSVRGFVGYGDFVFLKKYEDGIFYPITTVLAEGETSVMAFERVVYNVFGFDIVRERGKCLASKTESNNFFDYWIYRVEFEYDEEELEKRSIFKVRHHEFLEMLESGEYFELMPEKVINDIFGIVIKPTTRPLIIKSNVL